MGLIDLTRIGSMEGTKRMDEAEVEIVAEELAKLGGASWYPGREHGPILRVIHERYRDRARAAIAALDRYRGRPGTKAAPEETRGEETPGSPAGALASSEHIQIGQTVIYRPPGDRRSYPCTVEKISGSFVYLVPQDRTGISWVSISDLLGSATLHDLEAEEGQGQDGSHPGISNAETMQDKRHRK